MVKTSNWVLWKIKLIENL